MGLSLPDIIELAKAGYKPADVKELMKAASELESKPAEAEKPAEILPKEKAQPDQVKDEKPEKINAEDDKDIRIKQLEAQVEDLQKNLKQVQKENTQKNLQHEKPNEQEMLNNIARAFMYKGENYGKNSYPC